MEEDIAFRNDVQQFIAENLTAKLRLAGKNMTSVFADFDCALEWHKILHRKGWSAPEWPVEFGGTGWSPDQHYIFQLL